MGDCRALWFAQPRTVEIRAATVEAPGPDEVTVRTMFSGISGGTEMLAYRGELDPAMVVDETIGSLGGTFRYPFQYGYSCVGTVEQSRSVIEVGSLVYAFQPHQDVFVAASSDVIVLGDVDPRLATMLPLVETALQISLDAGPVFGETVAVFGLGAVGLLTTILLQRAGARVLAVDVAAWRRDAAIDLGAEALPPDELLDRVTTRRDPPLPVAIEVSGNPDALRTALELLAHEGLALVASWYGSKEVCLPLGAEFHRRRLTIRSTQVSTIPAGSSGRWTRDRRRRTVVDLLGELPLDRLATHTFDLDEAADAYAAIDSGRAGLIHVALGYR